MRDYKNRLLTISGAVFYVIIFNWCYVSFMQKWFKYMGYSYEAPDYSIAFIVFTWVLAILPSLWMPVRLERPSQVAYWVLYIMVIVPSIFIPGFIYGYDGAGIYLFNLVLSLCFLLLGMHYRLPLLSIPHIKIPSGVFWTICFAISIFTHVYMISKFGLKLDLVALADVYDVRSSYKQTLAGSSGLLAYLIGWQANVLNPLFIARGFTAKKPFSLLYGIMGQLLIFSITGFKSVLFSGMLIFGLYIIFSLKFGTKNFGALLSGGVSALILLLSRIALLSEVGFLVFSIFVRRLIMTNGILTAYYLQFFSENPKTLLAHSIMKGMAEYPYALEPPNLIGGIFYGTVDMSANVNIWADAFANFGLTGMIFYSLLLALFFWLYDSISQKSNMKITALLLAVPSLSLCNSALLTTLMTHGLLLAFLISYFLSGSSSNEKLSLLQP